MRESTITTQADVYAEEMPGTSDGVMMSGESPPALHASVSLVDCDTTDDGRNHKSTESPSTPSSPVTKLLSAETEPETDTETIERAVPVGQTVLPLPEPRPKIERNGIDLDKSGRSVGHVDNADCVVDCIYFAQQCCECVIL